MNSETSNKPFPTSASMASGNGGNGGNSGNAGSASQGQGGQDANGTVHRVAQKAHETVDRLEQTFGSSRERVVGMQQEYVDMVRDPVQSNPLAAVAIAFAAGMIFGRLIL